ncbi:MAG: leucine--tRNA ligase [Actinomycetia bacterium]|nr:leucine--tRNA ligase [Actinomycetes bacterium]
MDKSTNHKNYNAQKIEKKWIKKWNSDRIYWLETSKDDPKYYMLEMFPYPSGEPHMGHARNYTIGDVAARILNRKGHNVLHPIGFDAFGLPAENAAIKSGIHPRESTMANIEKMRVALKRMGMTYNFEDEIITSDPAYYKWTQWLFLLLHKMGLAEKKEAGVNWCNSCQTVLANEQVVTGKCERCDSPVVKKTLSQWFFKITKYAQRLIDDMKLIEQGWPERVLTIQKNWIGRSEGAVVNFKLEKEDTSIPVFTTRPDTLYGVTFFILSPEHKLVDQIVTDSEYKKEVEKVKNIISKQTDIERGSAETEKIGCFTGRHVINPLNGERVPVWIANYVLIEYGTGAIMAVPAHDQRDFDFARKYDIPIREVISETGKTSGLLNSAYEGKGIMVNSGPYTDMDSEQGKKEITRFLEEKKIGKFEINYKLKDWLISRQRYWGAPIPIIYCEKCGTVPVPEQDLPVRLPYDVDFKPTGLSPLAYCDEFVNTVCPVCGGKAKRETDTMDTFVCSSWYFLRYCSPDDSRQPFNQDEVDYWMPVDQYIGGIEHATMHLIYSRFFTKVLYDAGMVGFKEPFTKYFPHGVVNLGGKRMSKSRGNLVRPSEIYNRYGSDTLRLYILFMGPADSAVDWSDSGVEGSNRFLLRVWRLASSKACLIKGLNGQGSIDQDRLKGLEKEAYKKLHQTIKKVSEDILQRFNFNTAISALMEYVNLLYRYDEQMPDGQKNRVLVSELIKNLLILLSPMAPFVTEELWEIMEQKGSIHRIPWPRYNEQAAREETVTIVFQVNGKVRDKADLPAGLSQDKVKEEALASDNVQRFLSGKRIVKTIVVPDKLINLVAK